MSRRNSAVLAALVVLAFSAACSGRGAEPAEEQVAVGEEAAPAVADDPTPVADTLVVYKTESCGCCKDWVKHMERNGFTVVAHDREMVELNRLKGDVGVTPELTSCHTAIIGGYALEGHVPADLVKRMLAEKPQIAGLAVPGMPMGSPGMEGPVKQRYDVLAFQRDGTHAVYASR